MKKIAKHLTITALHDEEAYSYEYDVRYKGEVCQRIGSGGYRDVFSVPGTDYIIKLPNCLEEMEDKQTQGEWKAYHKIKQSRSLRGHIVRTYAPFPLAVQNKEKSFTQSILVGVQKQVDGVTWDELDFSLTTDKLKKQADKLYSALRDSHGENIMYDRKRDKLVIVDFGREAWQ